MYWIILLRYRFTSSLLISSGPAFSSIDTFCSSCCSCSLSRCIPQKLAYKSKGNLWNKSLVKIHKHKNSIFFKTFPVSVKLHKVIIWNKAGRLRPSHVWETNCATWNGHVTHNFLSDYILYFLIWQRIPNTLWIPFFHELAPLN